MNKLYLLLSILIINVQLLDGQKLIDHNYLSTVTKSEFTASFGLEAKYDVDMYKILYETNDVTGALDTASGLL